MAFMTTERDAFLPEIINFKRYENFLEVGVREGELSRLVLEATDARVKGYDIDVLPSAKALEAEFPGRCEIVEGRSPGVAESVPDGSFDVVYVDADHSEKAVAADLEAWWPKVRDGGLFCGDDYAFVDNPDEGRYGVVEAVNEFVDRYGLTLEVLGKEDLSREGHLAYARSEGEKITRYLNGGGNRDFQNPLWYVWKEA